MNERVSSWGIAAIGGIATLAFCAGTPGPRNSTPEQAARAAIRENGLLATLTYRDICGETLRVKAGGRYDVSRGSIVAAAPECGRNLGVARFETNLSGMQRTVFVTVSAEAATERLITSQKPKLTL